jgi:hypothetical protein
MLRMDALSDADTTSSAGARASLGEGETEGLFASRFSLAHRICARTTNCGEPPLVLAVLAMVLPEFMAESRTFILSGADRQFPFLCNYCCIIFCGEAYF